ncbi:23S rRNA (pseudouridine(1915)-N(3))-methyltransferase RlmH [Oxalobacter formigenes]|mgnify:FL=1|uniref:Ribosomal RNA large subunit methyltransferase H n=1 Tax=Oxalobacter formigenes OXCC13 TaxID=556269 RepID=C3X7M5_OXAFO|nr:23S rRNA (pseudouridine(1915)-N(3))-methyltransferase RlmH [Oxalobacter formigenes]ARQ46786.1 Ribosomal RNA large subunit methyltransferase H [Oxalobacter formigenes]ARQ78847.1 23S rRNA (pseudouridine(1915)-N(3))-methyltransferase RlmH [Oxalobacter formigenes OXCC13]EEO29201.1 putative rRNA large subunit m3Psi methyltransferase RlmH [Oxalobacter formigenes OXCC13]MCZ4062547.1 23S rRNA (pseudouridine(1915)-N(3))-methyltransferase RlmH [Oxalobacter formigenes]QDX32575.1 23S rRNA (pseudouridin
MQVTVVAVGHRMPDWIESGYREYAKRMPPEWHFGLKELKPIDRSSSKTAQTVMAGEAAKILSVIPKNARIIALDEHGKDFSTVQLASNMKQWQQDGRDIVFIIGGADGLDPDLKKKADMLVRLSSLTLPHGMVRILLTEQLYRASTILQNHPYHRS